MGRKWKDWVMAHGCDSPVPFLPCVSRREKNYLPMVQSPVISYVSNKMCMVLKKERKRMPASFIKAFTLRWTFCLFGFIRSYLQHGGSLVFSMGTPQPWHVRSTP